MIRRRRCPGFTMIELMMVVAIIAVLISLLLPAVQSSREAARRTQCANNLLQLGIAVANYESTHLVLPPGSVDPKGPVVEGPAAYQFGWVAQILPFMEQRNAYQHLNFNSGAYQLGNLTVRSVTIGGLLCPSDARRGSSFGGAGPSSFGPSLSSVPSPAQANYAACYHDVEAPIDTTNAGAFFLNSHVRLDEVEDGLGHTIFLGEKKPGGDELGWASGTRATLRNTGTPINQTSLNPLDLAPLMPGSPVDDVPAIPGIENPPPAQESPSSPPKAPMPIPVGGFGSSHPNGSNFVFGDGSVRFLRSTVNDRVYRLLGARADGDPIGDDQF